MDYIQKITENDLPRKWKNEIILEKSNPEDGMYYIRSNVANLKECNDWAYSFSENTSTEWNNRSSKPNPSVKIICKKTFVCHRSSYNKSLTTKSKRAIQKNTFCSALLDIVVKVTTVYTKRKDPYSKKGMPGIIRIKARHNHPIDSPSAFKFLTPSKNLQEKFYNYFELGMGLIGSCRHHVNKLLIDGVTDSTDSKGILKNPRFNPSRRTVQHWFDLWKKATECQRNRSLLIKEEDDSSIDENITETYVDVNTKEDPETLFVTENKANNNSSETYVDVNTKEDPETLLITENKTNNNSSVDKPLPESIETIIVPVLDVLQPTTKQNEMDCDDIIELPPRRSSLFKNIIFTMEKLHEKFGSELEERAAGELAARLNEIKTADEWVNFLHTAAKIPLRQTNVAKIKIQPVVIPKPNERSYQPVFR